MKFGQENKFFLGSSHHGVFSSSLIFSFGYTQPYPSLRSLVNPFILYPCTTSFILPSFILATHPLSFHPSSLQFIIHPCILFSPYFIPAPPYSSIYTLFSYSIIYPSKLHPYTSFILYPCNWSFFLIQFFLRIVFGLNIIDRFISTPFSFRFF